MKALKLELPPDAAPANNAGKGSPKKGGNQGGESKGPVRIIALKVSSKSK